MPVYTSLKGRGLQLNSYNWAICEDLKLRKEEEIKGRRVGYIGLAWSRDS
jgi:hypothetical protein